MHKKAGLIFALLFALSIVLLLVACRSYQSPKYQPPQTKDAFEKPYIGSEDAENKSQESSKALVAPSSPGKEDLSLPVDGIQKKEIESVDDVNSLISDTEKDVAAAQAETTQKTALLSEETVKVATTPQSSSEISSEGHKAVNTSKTASETVNLPTVVVNEGELVKVNVKAKDADGDELVFIFGSPLNPKGEWQTKKGDAGTTYASIRVSDGKTSTTGRVKIVVRVTNKAPVLKHIDNITVNEGETVKLSIVASDSDGDSLHTTVEGWMTGASRKTTYTDAGIHKVVVKVSDGKETTSQTVTVTVTDVNRPPVIEGIFGSVA